MRAVTIENMFREDLKLSKENPKYRKRGKWKRLPQNLSNRDLKAKLCRGTVDYCRKCECLDKCLFGQVAVERGI